ncbi:MAG: hypothetical protein QG594_928 [Bacteroidota bacterium]|nr:hypothetical protein [Bacteroidota bacterium]
MIKGLYETHLFVENLEISIDFYKNVLGLEYCHSERERRVAFFWIGKTKEAMLGIWEKPKDQIDKRHFAFRCDTDFILNESVNFLKSHNLKPTNFLHNGIEEPMVFAWIPALSIYFEDPDGHSLEFISILDGESKPENGILTYENWVALEKN